MSDIQSPGCVVLLADESSGMGAVMRELTTDGKASTRPNSQRVATAINALLKQLTAGPSFDLALVGYQTDAQGQPNVGSRWSGPLAGREFVPTGELAAATLRTETRVRKIPSPGGFGPPREETVEFPVWYEPTVGVKAPQIAAYSFCRDLLARWAADADPSPGTPLVVHVSAGASGDGNPQLAISKLMELTTPGGHPLVLQAHLAASAAVVTSLYPSNYVYLTLGSARDQFRRASVLPPHLVEALQAAHVTVNPGARGLIYNAKIADLIQMLSLVKSHTQHWPPKGGAAQPEAAPIAAQPEALAGADSTISAAAPGEPGKELAALIIFVLDRSVADPFAAGVQNPVGRLQEHANDLLKQVSKLPLGAVEVAIASYGLGSSGEVDVRSTFEGPLAGQTIVRHVDLADGAIRVEESQEEVSNGIGGLISVTRKKPIYFDLEPTAAAPPVTAFERVAELASEWCRQHRSACLAPIVLHLTRGHIEPADVDWAKGALARVDSTAGPVTLYHLVVTEEPHKSLAYPTGDEELNTPSLKKLWEASSLLLDRERLAAEKRPVTADSRGMVVNGKFDLLLEAVKRQMPASQ
ncbi:MAG TPA: hypothetical protein VG826_07350 [Pirellulales bacterium]|nr:hypothetical protein [Pirellulales bacterium]